MKIGVGIVRKIKATFLYTDNTSLIVLSNCELRGKTNKQTNKHILYLEESQFPNEATQNAFGIFLPVADLLPF